MYIYTKTTITNTFFQTELALVNNESVIFVNILGIVGIEGNEGIEGNKGIEGDEVIEGNKGIEGNEGIESLIILYNPYIDNVPMKIIIEIVSHFPFFNDILSPNIANIIAVDIITNVDNIFNLLYDVYPIS